MLIATATYWRIFYRHTCKWSTAFELAACIAALPMMLIGMIATLSADIKGDGDAMAEYLINKDKKR